MTKRRLSWMPLHVQDYESDTRDLTCEQDGAYMRLLRRCWQSGPISSDPAKLAQICGVTKTYFLRRIAPAVLPFFMPVGDGKISQKRLEQEREIAQRFTEKQQVNGAKKWQKPEENIRFSSRESNVFSDVADARPDARTYAKHSEPDSAGQNGPGTETSEKLEVFFKKSGHESGHINELGSAMACTEYSKEESKEERTALQASTESVLAREAEAKIPPASSPSQPSSYRYEMTEGIRTRDRRLMPRLRDKPHVWISQVAGGNYRKDSEGRDRPYFRGGITGYYIDGLARDVCEAAGITDQDWRGDWWVLLDWLLKTDQHRAFDARHIIDAIKASRAGWGPRYRPPKFLSAFRRAVLEHQPSDSEAA